MSEQLLNEHQRRRLSTNLHLLQEDLGTLARLPELSSAGAQADRVRHLLAEILRETGATRAALTLGEPDVISLRRRVAAVAEIWAVRVEDLAAHRLRGYGTVHPDLAARLDPHIQELVSLLERLAEAAGDLSER